MDMEVSYFLAHESLQNLITGLQEAGFLCIGPQVRDGAIVYDALTHAEQLPWGIRDHQSLGQYQLEATQEKKAFSWANGAQAIKPLLFKPTQTVWKVFRNAQNKIEFQPYQANEKPMAILGARSCDLAAMAIQDKVFLQGQHVDIHYQERRKHLFVVAINCSYSSHNCFCVSAGTGPNVRHPFDILMTEIEGGFVVTVGSERGHAIIDGLRLPSSQTTQNEQATQHVEQAAHMQTKRIPMNNSFVLRDLLFNNLEHPRWKEVGERCLSCGNCTQVCPTCFCSSEIEAPSLEGCSSEHKREWDSCFTANHSYLSGKVIRDDTRKRYRQWLTHKVGSWFDQFDVSGCVGCGRCISWCPVGIDMTEELAAISGESNQRETDHD